jgi:serine/threonine protein kinase
MAKKENDEEKYLEDETVNAKKLLSKAARILREVDEAEIFKTYPARELPSFERTELSFGPVLGVGGFCMVREFRKVTLRFQTTSESSDDKAAAKAAAAVEQHDDGHYDISTAREQIASSCLRDGDARYAIKHVHSDLSKLGHARGIIDLALEAKYLSVVLHPNIIKMRGWAACDPLQDGFFLVLDRLYDTLEEGMEKWKKTKKEAKGSFFGVRSNKEELRELMTDRLLVAYDLASAFRYLHKNKLVYRDTKPENIGFDVRGDVKLFDFGLVANLRPELKDEEGMYKLTGRTGSFPYMAPVSLKGLTCML